MNKSKIAKDTSILFFTSIVTKLISFIISIIIARFLGETSFGLYSFAIAFTSLFAIFSDFGMKVLLRREVSRNKKDTNKLFMDSMSSKIILSIISIIIVILFVKYTGQTLEKQTVIIIAALATLTLTFTDNIYSIFQGYERMNYGAILSILRNILRFIITYLLLVSGFGLISVLLIMLIVRIIELIASLVIYTKKISKIHVDIKINRAKKLFLRAIPFGVAAVFILIYYKIDIIMLSYMTNDKTVGYYSAAYNLIEGLLFIPLAFSTAITPLASKLFVQSKLKMKKLLSESLRIMIVVSIPLAIGISILAEKIILLFYGDSYTGSIIALRVLIWSIIPTFLHYILGLFIVSTNNEKKGMIYTGICASCNILINLILIPRYGLLGAAFATILTELLLLILSYKLLKKIFNNINIFKLIYKPIISGLLLSSIYFIKQLNIFLLIVIGAIIYIGTLYLLKDIKKEDIILIKQMVYHDKNTKK